VHLQYISKVQPTRYYISQFIYFNKMLYMFQAIPPPIIRSSNCTYSFLYCQTLLLPAAIMVGMSTGPDVLLEAYTLPTVHPDQFHPNHDSSRQLQGLTIPEAVCTI
jgi:hypothetical protein